MRYFSKLSAQETAFSKRGNATGTQRNARRRSVAPQSSSHVYVAAVACLLPPWTPLLWLPRRSLLPLNSHGKQPCNKLCWTENALPCALQTRKLGWPSTRTRKQPSYATSGAPRGNKLHASHENERPRANATCQSWSRQIRARAADRRDTKKTATQLGATKHRQRTAPAALPRSCTPRNAATAAFIG